MQKVIAYQDCAEDWRRRASTATDAQERGADERMAAVWELAECEKSSFKRAIPGRSFNARKQPSRLLKNGRLR
jgi:hypothetical protein